jgi:lauroyl/myristoyl acyltransferase
MAATGERLRRELEAIERPKSHLIEVRDEPSLARLYALGALHRVVPTRVAVKVAEAVGRADWRLSRARRDRALARARAVLGDGAGEEAVRALARRDLVEQRAVGELFWRPWEARRAPIEGLEHLTAARAAGRGVIVVSAHAGPSAVLFYALGARGVTTYLARFRKVEDDPVRFGPRARWTKMNLRWSEDLGCRWVGRGGSYEVFRALLERGEVCWMPFDVPGRVPTAMGGRRFPLATGIAHLACETGAAVVPGFVRRAGHRQVCWLEPPVDPRTFPDAAALHAHLGGVVGRVLFERPEQSASQIELLVDASAR